MTASFPLKPTRSLPSGHTSHEGKINTTPFLQVEDDVDCKMLFYVSQRKRNLPIKLTKDRSKTHQGEKG